MTKHSPREEFLSLLSHLMIIGLAAFLPVYTDGTWWQIGDKKYIVFQSISLFCLGIWVICTLVWRLFDCFGRTHSSKTMGWSPLDLSMCIYAVCVILSTIASPYLRTALFGYREWHMGAITQLMLVGIYFLVSRHGYEGKLPILFWQLAFGIVIGFGILHRLGVDPLGLMKTIDTGAWEYSHMISTIGNINWFCGYCSVGMVPLLAGYIDRKGRLELVIRYLVCSLGMTLLMIQGSDTGIALVAAGLFVLFMWSRNSVSIFVRTLMLVGGVSLLCFFYGHIVTLIGTKALDSLPADGQGPGFYSWDGWWILGVSCMAAALLVCKLSRTGIRRHVKSVMRSVTGLILLGSLLGGAFLLWKCFGKEGWGSGRDELWKLSLEGFLQNSAFRQWIGVGPDCYAEYVYSTFSGDALPILEGHWADAVFANAHNEWLNHLVNLGIMGTCSYLGIFVTAFMTNCHNRMAVLALVLYGVASLTGFQQCLGTPLLFVLLGMCEGKRRQTVNIKERIGYRDEMDQV